MKKEHTIGYLPDEQPPFLKLLLYALQQVVVMFPATVTVALITGFHISTTIFASGLATICFILITGRKIPLYYGSSFSYLAAIMSLMSSEQLLNATMDEKIAVAQFGIIMSGLVSIAAGFLVKAAGNKAVEKILPASITGPIAMIIGLTLAGNALSDICSTNAARAIAVLPELALNYAWLVGIITLLATILFTVYLKGFWGQLPLLLGPIVGCIAAGIVSLATGVNLFRIVPGAEVAGFFQIPHFTLPHPTGYAILAIMPIAIATIPESTAHIYQLDIYVNDLAKKKGSDKVYNLSDKLGLNLIGDGLGDMISAFVGGPAGTNYGENISAMAITKVFSTSVLIAAAIIAMVLSFFTPLVNAIYSLPQAVIGGLEVFLFGAIAAQGIAIMIDKKVDMFSAKNIAVIATIMVIGIGGNYAFGGNIPLFAYYKGAELTTFTVPCIAAAAVFGILLNLLLSIGEKKQAEE
ncbi:MAG: xanthine permease [Christensenellaceae bacterium]|jgi:uracil permease|nr:xanthine permease [Christensenellaceae bacterium]